MSKTEKFVPLKGKAKHANAMPYKKPKYKNYVEN